MSIDRDALIEATVKALVDAETNGLCGSTWPGPCDMCDCGQSAARERARVEHVLSKVLPLIADAIEDPIRHGEAVHYEFCSLAQAGALVRSLLGTDSDATASPSSPALAETGE